MSLFSLGRQPHRFQHKPIYYDEQKEKLKEMEQRATHTPAEIQREEQKTQNFRGVFVGATKHLRKRKLREANGYSPQRRGVIYLFLVLALCLLWYYLMSV